MSRQTELEQDYPTYVVCKWLGNTPNVAHKHYLTVTDDHYQQAVQNWGCNRLQCAAKTCTKKPGLHRKPGKT